MAKLRKDDETAASAPAPEETSSPAPMDTDGPDASLEGSDEVEPSTASDAGADPSASEDAALGDAGEGVAGDDTAALVQALSALPPEKLEQLVNAIEQVIMSKGGEAGGETAPVDGQGDAGQAASPPAEAGAEPGPVGQDAGQLAPEMGAPPEMPPEEQLAQSEKVVPSEALVKSEAKVAELEKAVGDLIGTLESVLTQPVRKAGKELAKAEKPAMPKFSELNKSEQTKALTGLSRNPSLTKFERSKINDFVLSKSVSINEIESIYEKYNK
jgi:hypothetical protein